MFWTDFGSFPAIGRTLLHGKQTIHAVTIIVRENLYRPNGIELDTRNERIFWVDEALGRVESIDYNGNNRKLLFQQSGLHPFGVTLVRPFLFFTGWNASCDVYKLDATTGKVVRNYSINGGEPMGIVAYEYDRQPPGI